MLVPDPQQWPPDYLREFNRREARIDAIRADQGLRDAIKARYSEDPVAWISHWAMTYDPRNAGHPDLPTLMPFIPFPRQEKLAGFLHGCTIEQVNGLIEKARDMGATWICCAFSVWLWLYWPGSAVGWGSRKEQLVDKIGDPDSIFEKMRIIIRYLPKFMLPLRFDEQRDMPFMKIVNVETGATITGEAGDNIGRGGRKLIYFKDEAQPLDAVVMTPDGPRQMGSLQLGDRVIGLDGKACRVTHINDCGEQDRLRFKLGDGSMVDCSCNHLWTVDKVVGKRERVTLRAHEIAASFAYRSPSEQTIYRYRLPLCAPVEFAPRAAPLPLDPYLVGCLLGDGGVKDVPAHCPKLTTADSEIVDAFERLLPEGCRIVNGGGMAYRLVDERGRQGNKVKSRARQAVVAAGIAGHGAETKYIPEAYKMAAPVDRLALLQGLMDTDGSACGNTATFHTCSPALADDVTFIVQSLGGVASRLVKPDRRGYRDIVTLHVRLALPLFRLSRKLAAHNRKQAICRTIVDVETMPATTMRCITVDTEDGLYLTDGFAVTHNSAHYERPEKIEAALSDTTNCQIDISSVNGLGNVFHRRREAGLEWSECQPLARDRANVFVMDWSDHPAKSQQWYDERRKKAESDGLLHVFAQEVERNYSAAVAGVIIPADWVSSAIDAHLKLGFDDSGAWRAALDPADEGGDLHALAIGKGSILHSVEDWGEGDTGAATRKTLELVKAWGALPLELQYDSVGVGAGVKSEANRLAQDLDSEGKPLLPKGLKFVPWSAGAGVLDPDERVIPNDKQSPLNKDFYANLKAQAWWQLRLRFERTHKAIHNGDVYDPADLISLPSTLAGLQKLRKELSQATRGKTGALKMLVNKTPEGTRSPNMADAVVMAFWPLPPATRYSWDV